MSSSIDSQLQTKNLIPDGNSFKKLFLLPLILLFFIFALQDIFLYIIQCILVVLGSIYPSLQPQHISDSNLLFLTLFLNAILDILPLIVLGILIPFKLYKFNDQKKQKQFGLTHVALIYLAVTGTAYGTLILIGLIMSSLGLQSPQSSYESITLTPQNANLLNIFLLFALLCIIAPIFEETVFRRQLIPTLEGSGYGTFTSVILSSFLFGLAHSTNDIVNGNLTFAIIHLVATTTLGFGLGTVYVTTRNVRWNMALHGLFNFTSFIGQLAMFYSGTTANNINPSHVDPVLVEIGFLLLAQTVIGLIIMVWALLTKGTLIRAFFNQFYSPSKDSISKRRFYFAIILLIGLYIVYFVIWSILRDVYLIDILTRLINDFMAYFFVLLINIVVFLLLALLLFKNRQNIQLIWNVSNPDINMPVGQPYQDFFMPNTNVSYPPWQNQSQQLPMMNISHVQKFCGYCGASINPNFNSKFCSNCGKPLLDSKP